jgi:hypothetical protein
MRRRSGNPSTHHESAGKSMIRNHSTSDEAHMSAKASGSTRIAMGMDAYEVSAPPALTGTPVQRQNVQSQDPTGGGKVNTTNVPYNEKLGSSYRVTPKATFVQIDPAAGPTMQSARIVPSISGRENPNFESGIQGAQSF